MEGTIGCILADLIENKLSLHLSKMVAQVLVIKNELTSLEREHTLLAGCLSRMKTLEKILETYSYQKMGYGIARFDRQSYIDSFLYSEIMQTNLFSSMSNGCKKRNRKLVSGYLLSQERERKRKQRQLRHREESLTSQPQRKSKRKEGPLEKLINLGPLHTRAKVFDDRTQRGTNKNGKITDWERKLNWERELEEITKLVTMETKASQCLDDVPMVTKFTGMKASQQILCYIDQIKVQWPMQPDLLVIKQEIQEIDRKYKDAALAEDEAKWRLLLVGGKIEELDRQRSEFYFAPRWPEKVTPTDYRAIMLTCEELLSKFRDLENQLYDKDNNKVEYKDFLGLEQALKKTAWGKTPDYLQTIATRIEKARGKATDVFHIPAQVPICAAIKEMEDFPVEDLDWDTLKKWGATLNYAKKYGFQVGFADNLLSKNLLAYLVIQNLPN